MHQTIALVDDDQNILTSVSMALEAEGFHVRTYKDGEDALRGLSRQPVDLAVLDIKMPRMDGMELLQNLQNQLGVSYLFITHDLATVKAIADSIVVMYQGRVVEQGAKAEILSPPHEAYTELLLSSVPEMDPDWLDTLVERRKRGELPTAESIN